jgi:hypothetical protein
MNSNLVVQTQIGTTSGLPAVSSDIRKLYPIGQTITQAILLEAAGSAGSQFAAPVGFSQITVDVGSPVQLTAQKGSNTAYLNQTVNKLTIIDDTVDSFQITNNSNQQVAVTLTWIVAASGTSVVPGVVTSINGMTGAVTLSASSLTGLAVVAQTGNYYDLLNRPQLATVASTGDYNDLLNKPSIPNAPVNADWNANSGLTQILHKPNLSTVAISGQYADLQGLPNFAVVAVSGKYGDLIERPTLSAVATSGSYADLINRPVLAAVATSGSYADLTNTPPAYVLQPATNTTLGGVKVSTGLTIASDGTTTLDIATPTQLGGVKQGTNIIIAQDGTLSVNMPEVSTRRINGYSYALTVGQPIVDYITTDTLVFGSNLAGSLASCIVAPISQITFQIMQLSLDRTQSLGIGVLTFNPGSNVGTFSGPGRTVPNGYIVEIQGPSIFDPAMRGLSVVLLGQAQ